MHPPMTLIAPSRNDVNPETNSTCSMSLNNGCHPDPWNQTMRISFGANSFNSFFTKWVFPLPVGPHIIALDGNSICYKQCNVSWNSWNAFSHPSLIMHILEPPVTTTVEPEKIQKVSPYRLKMTQGINSGSYEHPLRASANLYNGTLAQCSL